MTKSKRDHRKILETLQNPVRWGETYLQNRDGSPRTYWPHQVEDLICDERNIVHLDGRDVGKCMCGNVLILDTQTGERIRIDQLKPGRTITVLAPNGKLETTTNYQVHANGPRPTFKLTTRLGRSITATGNHPFLTDHGWRTLDDLQPRSWLAVPRNLPVSLPTNPAMTDDQLQLLAFLLADGSLTSGNVVFTKEDPLIADEFQLAVGRTWPWLTTHRFDEINYRVVNDPAITSNRLNACRAWLEGHGLFGCRSENKFIPDEIFRCSSRQVAVFLAALFGCDGWFCLKRRGTTMQPEVGYCSASMAVIDGIAHLLMRVGIVARTRTRMVDGRPYRVLEIKPTAYILRFERLIGMAGIKGLNLAAFCSDFGGCPEDPDSIPKALIQRVLRSEKSIETKCNQGGFGRYNTRRFKLGRIARQTRSSDLHKVAASDIYWDEVTAIEPAGIAETYDLSVPGYRNFVANDIIVHNSICLTTDCLHFGFTTKGGKGLIAAPHQGQLDTLAEEIEYQVDHNPDLARSIAKTRMGAPKIIRKPYFRVEFTNGTVLYFRPAGANGESFRSLHVHRVWVDEGAWLTERAWKALRQCLLTGGRMRIYSTPNGMRNTTYYRLTTNSSFKVFRWPSWISPLWTKDRERDLLDFYGGRDTAGWQHEVAGEHGKPSYSAFNLDAFNACRKEVLAYSRIAITGAELTDCADESAVFDRLEMLLNLEPQDGVFWIGGDLGYTNDPTELVVFREDESGGKPVLTLFLRVHMEQVAYPCISQVIALLDHHFSATGIGVDYGGNGMAVVQELLGLDKYKSNSLNGRLLGIHFGGMTTVTVRGGQEIKKRTKEHMTQLINGALQRRELIIPASDSDIEDEFTTHTYVLRDGRVIYSKGHDHIIDAVRCAMLVRERSQTNQDGGQARCVLPVVTNPVFL
ncbi:Intein splicing domain-containing protein [Sulfidibacter corallicola]|uniref:DOD-type homing endonuclease domain-containing protein n=1 Tax=Sulfidibacter corallicola TaxID=2818388 RepID=A0A8A4TSX4_SULCO|nr:LAGLIDADG family homing endonuclease [Sulfidibacter corallicola]QTD49645.1 hypothetical protein J3U87_29025 [Sulfidibacter corallicola]